MRRAPPPSLSSIIPDPLADHKHGTAVYNNPSIDDISNIFLCLNWYLTTHDTTGKSEIEYTAYQLKAWLLDSTILKSSESFAAFITNAHQGFVSNYCRHAANHINSFNLLELNSVFSLLTILKPHDQQALFQSIANHGYDLMQLPNPPAAAVVFITFCRNLLATNTSLTPLQNHGLNRIYHTLQFTPYSNVESLNILTQIPDLQVYDLWRTMIQHCIGRLNEAYIQKDCTLKELMNDHDWKKKFVRVITNLPLGLRTTFHLGIKQELCRK